MKLEEVRYWINQLSSKQKLLILLQALLKGTGFGVLFFALAQSFNISINSSLVLSIGLTIIFIAASLYLSKIWLINNNFISHSLNQLYPQLQNSADLVLSKTQSLSTLQQIQQLRVVELINIHRDILKLPNELLKSSGLFLFCLVSAFLLMWNQNSLENQITRGAEQSNADQVNISLATPTIETIKINISPPAYTQIKPYPSPLNNVSVPEGSVVNLSMRFNQSVESASLIFLERIASI